MTTVTVRLPDDLAIRDDASIASDHITLSGPIQGRCVFDPRRRRNYRATAIPAAREDEQVRLLRAGLLGRKLILGVLAMPLAERRARQKAPMKTLRANSIGNWHGPSLDQLQDRRQLSAWGNAVTLGHKRGIFGAWFMAPRRRPWHSPEYFKQYGDDHRISS